MKTLYLIVGCLLVLLVVWALGELAQTLSAIRIALPIR